MQVFKLIAGATLLTLSINAASQTVDEVFKVPFDGCEKSFGSGENIWYFCPDKIHTVKTDRVSETENALIQSLPIRGKLRLSFVCRSTEPVLTTISIDTQNFQVNPDATLVYHDFEAFLDYAHAGITDWVIASNLRKSDYVSLKKGCYSEVSQNLSLVHIPAVKIYSEYLAANLTDLAAILEALQGTVTSDLSEARVALDAAIKNIQSVSASTSEPATRLLLKQSLTKLQAIQKNISQACEASGAPLCTSTLASARQTLQSLLENQVTDLGSLKDFIDDEIKRLSGRADDIVKQLQNIKDNL